MLLSAEELLDTAALLSEELSLDELCGTLEKVWLDEDSPDDDSLEKLLLDAPSLELSELVDETAFVDDWDEWLSLELLLPPQAARSPLRAITSPSLRVFMLFPLVGGMTSIFLTRMSMLFLHFCYGHFDSRKVYVPSAR